MLIIRTGLMGHGKSLNTIKEVDEKAFRESRPVYFHNITDLKPDKLKADWFEFDDPHKWFELPVDAIIVIDEAQQFFPVRDPRKDVPEYCSRFEVMRKQGHEVNLITQDPRFIDVHARRLCNLHIHYNRIFGSQKIARFESQRVFNEVEKISTSKDVDRSVIQLDKRFFGVYSSAQAKHHFKFKPSKKLIFFTIATIATVFLVARVIFTVWGGDDDLSDTVQQTIKDNSPFNLVSSAPDAPVDAPLTRDEYLAQYRPRIPDIPSSAPVYDDLTSPQTFPRLQCISSVDPGFIERTKHRSQDYKGQKTSCVCYSQQATRLHTSFDFCMQIVEQGYFDQTRPDRYAQQALQPSNQPVNQQQQYSHLPPTTTQQPQPDPYVTIIQSTYK